MKKYLTTKNIIFAAIIIGLVILLFQVDSCRNNQFKSQQGRIDSLTLANQKLYQDKNKLGQIVSKQQVIMTDDQKSLKKMAADIFQLKDKDQKRIKQINALITMKTNTKIDSIEIAYVDTLAQKRFSDSLEKVCAEVIAFYRDSSIRVPKHVKIDSIENKDFQFDGDITKTGFKINSVNFPDSQTIDIAEIKGGFFRRGINGKVKFYTPKKLEVHVIHSNKYIQVTGMNSLVYQPKVGGRWLERILIFGVGVVATTLILK